MPSKTLSGNQNRSFDFWYLERHDRATLITRILPYMAKPLRQGHFPEIDMDANPWIQDFMTSKVGGAAVDLVDDVRPSLTAFWSNPIAMVHDLQEITQHSFFSLLRYNYRERFYNGHHTARRPLDLQDFFQHRFHNIYRGGLTTDEIYCLTRLPHRYGASFYRASYRETVRCAAWTHFAERVRDFCQSLGLRPLFNNPESNLRELQQNMTFLVVRRTLNDVNAHLHINAASIMDTKAEIEQLGSRIPSGTMQRGIMTKAVEQGFRQMELRTVTSSASTDREKKYTELDEKLEKIQVSLANLSRMRTIETGHGRENSEQPRQSMKQPLPNEAPDESVRMNANEEARLISDKISMCRWLLEKLPSRQSSQDGLGNHWRIFWQIQWKRCAKVQPGAHPLRELIREEKYNSVGKKLYATLSNRLHNYGEQRGNQLCPDVQRVMRAIEPLNFTPDGSVDLARERLRWTA